MASQDPAPEALRDRLRARLEELRGELEIGEQRRAALARETEAVTQTMLRISGAIQVLGELLEEPAAPDRPRSDGPSSNGPSSNGPSSNGTAPAPAAASRPS